MQNTDDLNTLPNRQVEDEMFGEPFQRKRPDIGEEAAAELVDLAHPGPVS